MFRSLLLMVLLGETSITEWAGRLKRDKVLKVIAGWDTGDTPGTGTFYLFMDRLQDGPYQKSCKHIHKPSSMNKGLHRRNLKEEKEKPEEDFDKNDSVTENLAKKLKSQEHIPRQEDLAKRLEDIFMLLAVIPSARAGLLGNLHKLQLVGDGSTFPSYANENGRPTCKCFEKGIKKCTCDRLYSDLDADWGWDSYHEIFFFGDRFYQYCYGANGHNLPLHVYIGPASESDMTLCLKSFDRMMKMFIENHFHVRIDGIGMDKGHDALGIYKYFLEKIIPVAIPLRGKKNPYEGEPRISEKGKPICKAGLEMRYHNYDKKKMRQCYCCPVKRPTRRDGIYQYVPHPEECPLGVLCEPDAKMAPIVSLGSKDNPRLYPMLTRDSDKYKEILKDRGSTERSNSFKKVAYPLEKAKCRSRAHRLIRLYLISIIEHRKVLCRVQNEGLNRAQILQKVLDSNGIQAI